MEEESARIVAGIVLKFSPRVRMPMTAKGTGLAPRGGSPAALLRRIALCKNLRGIHPGDVLRKDKDGRDPDGERPVRGYHGG
jgi:hypothetical protein